MERYSAIYTRQSIDKLDSISTESQTEFAMYELRGDTNYKIYSDKGYSGKNINRPDFQKLLEDIKKGLVKKVIVYKLDRISRSVLDFANMMEDFQKYNVEFVSCNEKFDTSTPIGRAMLSICIVFAQLERETIQQRVKDAYISRSQKGFYMGGPVPYGYRAENTQINGINTKTYVVEPTEAEHIKIMFKIYANPHTSMTDILNYFLANNIKMANGHDWVRARLSDQLRNPVYVKADYSVYEFFKSKGVSIVNNESEFIGENGCYLYSNSVKGSKYTQLAGRTLVLATHKGIVDPNTWLACRTKALNNEQIQTSRKVKNTWLAGLVKCGRCGYALTFKKYKTRKARYLLCSRKMNDKACEGAGTIYADDFEELIFSKMVEKLKEFKTLSANQGNQVSPQITAINIELKQIEQEIDKLVDSLSRATGALIQYINSKVGELDSQKKALEEKLTKLEEESQKAKVDTIKVSDCIAKWEDITLEEKQEVSWALINRIYATKERVKIEWKI